MIYDLNQCSYSLGKLKPVIYYFDRDDLLIIDNQLNEMYAQTEQTAERYICQSVTLETKQELDKRYTFSTQLRVVFKGYNKTIMNKKGVIGVETEDGKIWLINVDLDASYQYQYNLDESNNEITFTIDLLSNFPIMEVTCDSFQTFDECGYNNVGIKRLMLVEQRYVIYNGILEFTKQPSEVKFTQCSLTERYNKNGVSHQITFSYPLDGSYHFDISRFHNNLYTALIITDGLILSGYLIGYQPLYTIGEQVTIELNCIEDSYLKFIDEQIYNDEKSYYFTNMVNGVKIYKCGADGKALYLLKAEYNSLGHPTGFYKVLEGYEDYGYINVLRNYIIGTFSEQVIYNEPDCITATCQWVDQLPEQITINGTNSVQMFDVESDGGNWEITNIPSWLSVSETQGNSGQHYVLQFSHSSQIDQQAMIKVTLCEQNYYVNVKVIADPMVINKTINLTAQMQDYSIMVSAGSTVSCLGNYEVNGNVVTVHLPMNDDTTNSKTTAVNVVSGNITYNYYLVQDVLYEEWRQIDDNILCIENMAYQQVWRFIGYYPDRITIMTGETNIGTRVSGRDSECYVISTRWLDTDEPICVDNVDYIKQKQQISYDFGVHWSDTGEVRASDELYDGPMTACQEEPEPQPMD